MQGHGRSSVMLQALYPLGLGMMLGVWLFWGVVVGTCYCLIGCMLHIWLFSSPERGGAETLNKILYNSLLFSPPLWCLPLPFISASCVLPWFCSLISSQILASWALLRLLLPQVSELTVVTGHMLSHSVREACLCCFAQHLRNYVGDDWMLSMYFNYKGNINHACHCTVPVAFSLSLYLPKHVHIFRKL